MLMQFFSLSVISWRVIFGFTFEISYIWGWLKNFAIFWWCEAQFGIIRIFCWCYESDKPYWICQSHLILFVCISCDERVIYRKYSLEIHHFRLTRPFLIIKVLANNINFLEPSGYYSVIDCVFTFCKTNVFGCFHGIMAQFSLIKRVPKLDHIARSSVHLSNHFWSEECTNTKYDKIKKKFMIF